MAEGESGCHALSHVGNKLGNQPSPLLSGANSRYSRPTLVFPGTMTAYCAKHAEESIQVLSFE